MLFVIFFIYLKYTKVGKSDAFASAIMTLVWRRVKYKMQQQQNYTKKKEQEKKNETSRPEFRMNGGRWVDRVEPAHWLVWGRPGLATDERRRRRWLCFLFLQWESIVWLGIVLNTRYDMPVSARAFRRENEPERTQAK